MGGISCQGAVDLQPLTSQNGAQQLDAQGIENPPETERSSFGTLGTRCHLGP